MEWWVILIIVIFSLVGFVSIFLMGVRALNSRKPKFDMPKKQEEQPLNDDVKIQFEELSPSEIEKEQPEEQKSAVSTILNYGRRGDEDDDDDDDDDYLDDPFGDFDDDAEIERELRSYQEIIQERSKKKTNKPKPKPKQEDDFEKFRNEYCYSKFLMDKKKYDEFQGLPENVRKVILNDVFEKKSVDNIEELEKDDKKPKNK